MSLQWTFIATFLYTEIFLCVLLMLPIISPQRWQKIFKSRLLSSISSYANLYFNIFIVILVVLFIDAVREMWKYHAPKSKPPDMSNNPMAEAVYSMKMFRAQRNYYMAIFAVMTFFVLRKLVTTISSLASAQADAETMKKQAESANAVAKQLMEDIENKSNEKEEGSAKKAVADVADSKELDKLRDELTKASKDMAAMRKQAESVNREYDRLLKEHGTLQEKYTELEGSGGSKKDE